MPISPNIRSFISQLPDPNAAERFIERLFEEHPNRANSWAREPRFFSNMLTLAAYSPWLGQTMIQQPDYIDWLKRERDLQIVKGKEQLLEELARFASRQFELTEQVALARFKRRELLRIYLRDCLRLATLTELTEDLSNLADTLLEHALNLCYQRLTNRFGAPLVLDARGRAATAEFAIIALGKLGSRELNYASDIDLMFIYSEDGKTAGNGLDPNTAITNREFFVKLSENIAQLIGQAGGEGAVYRTDFRLRPNGSIGLLAYSLSEFIRYYEDAAQNWERQALIKARCAAGSNALVAEFLSTVSPVIYKTEPLVEALRDVRNTKDKIDHFQQKNARSDRYNVKLGRGGIREIEFIVQAFQLAYGGREPWLRVPQTLIGLQRLSDKSLITDRERTQLSDAYTFLRTVEHRLQMEHGVQTHSLPVERSALAILGRRLGFDGNHQIDAAGQFQEALEYHRSNVTVVYDRVFSAAKIADQNVSAHRRDSRDAFTSRAVTVVSMGDERIQDQLISTTVAETSAVGFADISDDRLKKYLALTRNPVRALKNLRAFVASLATYVNGAENLYLTNEEFPVLISILGSGQYFAQMLINNPLLADAIRTIDSTGAPVNAQEMIHAAKELRRLLNRSEEDQENNVSQMDKQRRAWHEEMIRTGVSDIVDGGPLVELNRRQTALALATLEEAVGLAEREQQHRYGWNHSPSAFAVLGLGRIAHWGMDYGSDLDLLFVYQDTDSSNGPGITISQYFSELAERVIQTLSMVTREGYFYRVDMRLRPDGSKGMLAQSSSFLIDYVQRHAAIWERLAYLRVRHVAGDTSLGEMLQRQIVDSCFTKSDDSKPLAEAVIGMREKLIREHVRRSNELNIRWGRGAMMDVYFITRFLQMKHGIANPEIPGTLSLIRQLIQTGILTGESGMQIYDGYEFFRRVDHQLRMMYERVVKVLPQSQSLLTEIALALGFNDAASFIDRYNETTIRVDKAFGRLIC